MTSKVAGPSESPVCGLSGAPPGRPPHKHEDGGFSRASLAWDALTLGRSHGQFGPEEATATHTHGPRAQHPLVAAAGNVASTPDHSSHPTCLPTPGPHLEPSGVASRGGGGGRLEGAQAAFIRSPVSPELLLSPIRARHPRREHTGVTPVTTKGEGRGAAVAVTYLCPGSRAAAPATRPRSRASAPEQNKPL